MKKKNEETCACNLEQVVLLKFFEHAAFDFNELVGHEKGQKRIVIRVYGDVQAQHLIYHHQCMRHCSSDIYFVLVRELKVVPVYNVAKRKNTIGRIVCAVKGNLQESRRRVDRENKQSRMSCPMDAQSLSAIC